MRLGLSSAGAPDATLQELAEACVRRGLATLELIDGHGHGISDTDIHRGVALCRAIRRSNVVELTAFHTEAASDTRDLAALSDAIDLPVVIGGVAGPQERAGRAREVVDRGGSAVVLLRDDEPDAHASACAAAALGICWEVNPAAMPIPLELLDVIQRERAELHSIRLRGGGPETSMHEGRGVGALLHRLAISGWSGTMILAPGSAQYRIAWQIWLGRRRGGNGCGSAGEGRRPARLLTLHDAGGAQ